MKLLLRLIALAGAALLCALGCPAWADTTVYGLAGSWVKVGSAGSSVYVHDAVGSVVLSTAASGGGAPTVTPATGIGLLPGQGKCFTLTADLYAYSSLGQVNAISGVKCSSSGEAVTLTPAPIVLTSTEVPVVAATSTLILAANASRRFARITNDNTGTCRVSYGAAATASTGEPVASAAAQYGQGGGITFDAAGLTQQAFYAYCAAASSFAVVEGQ